ncbi:MAG TPA: hypothetical protein VFS75_02675 [Candidatus Paceibacterota bacterium]|nr:hypothetical protein [Candidatus Paceibacterota bacterium]
MRLVPPFPAFAILAIALIAPASASAQDSAGVTIMPAMVEKGANPGDTLHETLSVTNDSAVDKDFYIFTKDIKGVEGGGMPIFADPNLEQTGYELSSWVTLPGETVHVPANDSVDVPVTVSIPTSATPGSHFGGVFVSEQPPKLRENGASVGFDVASVFSIRIAGDIIDTARIREFSTDKLVYSSKHVTFKAKVENQGNILIRPRGPLSITSMFSKTPTVITVNDSQAGVFPGSIRDFDFDWDDEGIGFGRYEAVLALTYDGENGQKTIDSTLVFWIFPTQIVLAFIGGFLAIFLLGYFAVRYYINQAVMRASGGRRIVSSRYRRQGVSRFAFLFLTFMVVVVLFLLVLLVFFA